MGTRGNKNQDIEYEQDTCRKQIFGSGMQENGFVIHVIYVFKVCILK